VIVVQVDSYWPLLNPPGRIVVQGGARTPAYACFRIRI
jgi:hypothetical protein